jgi:hypothetical protein
MGFARNRSAYKSGESLPINPIVGGGAFCCARRERPRDRRNAKLRDELAAPHSITSSPSWMFNSPDRTA